MLRTQYKQFDLKIEWSDTSKRRYANTNKTSKNVEHLYLSRKCKKTKVKCHFTSTKEAKIKSTDDTMSYRDWRTIRTPIHY